jgi:hypothetical protein
VDAVDVGGDHKGICADVDREKRAREVLVDHSLDAREPPFVDDPFV